ncbi:NAD(P)-binding protein [Cryphonectria parasitica EP155]|uniref:NAD(P)-binding protein n=1 Tax=Cryphonectria parasitica (strain ATCC 38755 / EP155) TaxID=660469 RepID=A0A9P5CT44_CRYP1|nr:NAD(P)-binding protein [Cryphonectria parasitica EP155]KAF3770269.1 NAD(P)-binding protein [Cryphonectria parasitica EP155]
MPVFIPERDIPRLSGKIILITGGTSGIGRETVLALARHDPSHIYFTGRNATAATAIISQARDLNTTSPPQLTFIPLDLASSREHIRAALVSYFHSSRLDILIANAGIMGTPPGLTEEGWELQWGTNYMGHTIMLHLLRPLLLRTASADGADVRFVCVSSLGHKSAPAGGVQFDNLKSPDAVKGEFARYGQSKLAQILLCRAMARHHPEIVSLSVHPGLVKTGLLGSTKQSALKLLFQATPFMQKSAKEGAYNTLWAATSDRDGLVNGAYLEPVGRMKGASKISESDELAERLWQWTENELERLELL